jgi:phosphinothricin acetyltransferase
MLVRIASADDLPEIVRIYNHAIETSTATFDLTPYSVDQRLGWFEQFGATHPLLVAEGEAGTVAGFAYYLPYRAKEGYRFTKETTIYVDARYQRRGTGSALYAALVDHARRAGVHALIAVLGGRNPASEAFHVSFGFQLTGRNPEVGWKFGQWVDTYTYQLIL